MAQKPKSMIPDTHPLRGPEFDIDSAPDAEPKPSPDEAALTAFNRALQEAASAEFGVQPF